MNKDFEKCLKNRRIVKQGYVGNLVQDELRAAKGDLERAKKTFADSGYKWTTIQAYYSMFHAAKALLYAKGFREKSHFCLKAATQALYADEGILEQKYVDDFDATMLLRETADYKSDFSKEGAKSSIESAGNFLTEAEKILRS